MKQVKADTMLIESDMVGKAILDLIPVLNVRKLVVGAAKSSLRYKLPPSMVSFVLFLFFGLRLICYVWFVLFLFFGYV